MLNNLTNFFNIITGKMIKKVPENSDLIPLGTKDSRYGGSYKPTAISVEDFMASIVIPETYLYLEIPLSSAEIKLLGGSLQLLPTPGANKYYIIEQIAMEYTFNTLAYIFPTSSTFYLDGCFDSYIDKTFLTSSTDTVATISGNLRNTYSVGTGSGTTLVKTNKDVLNANLIIGTQNNDNPTTGDGTMLIKIWYKIETKG